VVRMFGLVRSRRVSVVLDSPMQVALSSRSVGTKRGLGGVSATRVLRMGEPFLMS